MIWRNSTLLSLVSIAGCSTFHPPMHPGIHHLTWSARKAQLQKLHAWQLTGVIGVRTANHSSIADIVWHNNLRKATMVISAPLSFSSMSLSRSGNYYTLVTPKKKLRSTNPELLMEQQLGWSLPIASLHYWVKGLPTNSSAYHAKFDRYNHLAILKQQGWTLHYSNYVSVKNVDLPAKIVMSNSYWNFKLIIHQWML